MTAEPASNPTVVRSVATVGDVGDIRSWSGTPFHFLEAAREAGFASAAWRLDLDAVRWARSRWNLGQLLQGRKPGGFQYSPAFMKVAAAQIPEALFASEIITFHQHFPPASLVEKAGGSLNHYLDATFAALSTGRGLDLPLPRQVAEEGRLAERENYRFSRRIVTMARWTAESVVSECAVEPGKVTVILPGANCRPPPENIFLCPEKRPGQERDFVLGFVGMDWKRKGLPFVVRIRDLLARRGWRVCVRVAGRAPDELKDHPGVEFAGRIEKNRAGGDGFYHFLAGCDVGCLFSDGEALGISTLEFLRAGVPVAGFAHQGPADTLPPDAGFRFALGTSAEEVATTLDAYLKDESQQETFRRNAQRWSPLMTWERCVAEMQELWETGSIQQPVKPWLGLSR